MTSNTCGKCDKEIDGKDHYSDGTRLLCEQCYMEHRGTYARKTHWQYIRSIKGDYLTPPRR